MAVALNALVVEDDDSVARFLSQALGEAGYGVAVTGDGSAVLDMVRAHRFDVILLDVMLLGMDGLEVCRQLRDSGDATPVLMITARDSTNDKIAGLDSGADDYVVKPFDLGELLARVRALLRRRTTSASVLRVGDLTLDPTTRRACRAGKRIALSATEYALLEYLMRNAGEVVARSAIMDHVWEYDFGGNDTVLGVYINYLRNKIDRGHEPPLIHTVRGVGFCMSAEGCPDEA